MKQADHQWLNLINRIEEVGEDRRLDYKVADELRRKKYYSLIQEDCDKHQRRRLEIEVKKLRQRELIDRAVQRQKKESEQKIRSQMEYEKQFGEDNKLLFKHKRHKTQEGPAAEHPFIRLVDGQQHRQQMLRNMFRHQNEINKVQENVKKQQKNRQRQLQQEQRKNYEEYVESVFRKRELDNCQARLKYNWHKNANSEVDQDPQNSQKRLQKQYLNELQEQVKHLQKNKRSRTDNSMNIYEQQVNYSPEMFKNSASPAFLGKLPFSHDRKRQLQIINRKLGLNEQQIQRQLQQRSRIHYLPLINQNFRQAKVFNNVLTEPAKERNLSRQNRNQVKINQTLSTQIETNKINFNIELKQPKKTQKVPSRTQNATPSNQPPSTPCKPKSIRSFKTYDFLSGQYSTFKIQI